MNRTMSCFFEKEIRKKGDGNTSYKLSLLGLYASQGSLYLQNPCVCTEETGGELESRKRTPGELYLIIITISIDFGAILKELFVIRPIVKTPSQPGFVL